MTDDGLDIVIVHCEDGISTVLIGENVPDLDELQVALGTYLEDETIEDDDFAIHDFIVNYLIHSGMSVSTRNDVVAYVMKPDVRITIDEDIVIEELS